MIKFYQVPIMKALSGYYIMLELLLTRTNNPIFSFNKQTVLNYIISNNLLFTLFKKNRKISSNTKLTKKQ